MLKTVLAEAASIKEVINGSKISITGNIYYVSIIKFKNKSSVEGTAFLIWVIRLGAGAGVWPLIKLAYFISCFDH
jgi:hypothetical protein